MSGTLYTSRIRACSLYCPSAQRVTSITNKYIALGKYTGATRASGLRYTSAKLLLAEQTHTTHYYWHFKVSKCTKTQTNKDKSTLGPGWQSAKRNAAPMEALKIIQPKVTTMGRLLLRLEHNATWIWSYNVSKQTKSCFIENPLALDHAVQITEMQNCCWPRQYQLSMTSACWRQTHSWPENSPNCVWSLL